MTMPAGFISGNPVQLSIVRQDKYSRGLAFLGCLFLYGRVIALIPILIVLYVLGIVAFFVAWIMQFAVLFTGSYPAGAHNFLTGFLRWSVRSQAWLFGLSDKYPTTMQP
jgi:uncharacterized membrane protein